MCLRIQYGENGFIRASIWHVVHALASFIFHYIPLKIDLGKIHRWQQESHPVGIEPESEGQCVRGQGLVIVCPVLGGGPVIVGACRLEQLIERANRDVLGSHAHDVLEEMRETGSTDLLAARPDMLS